MHLNRHPADVIDELRVRFEPVRQLAQRAWEQDEIESKNPEGGSDCPMPFQVDIARALIAFGDDINEALQLANEWTEARKEAEV